MTEQNNQPSVERRAGMQGVQSELARLSQQFGQLIGEFAGVKTALEHQDKDIAELRVPNRQPVLVQGGLAVFLLTVVALLYNMSNDRIHGQNEALATALAGQGEVLRTALSSLKDSQNHHEAIGFQHKTEFRKHVSDGHSQSVRDELGRVEQELTRKITSVDQIHASENREQEEDIEQGRQKSSEFERRIDSLVERVAVMEAKVEERTALFNQKASDRWTKTQDDDRHSGLISEIASMKQMMGLLGGGK